MEQVLAILMENVVPVAATAITALVTWAVVRLESFIRRSENKVDDEIFDAFLDGVAEGAKRPDPQPEKVPDTEPKGAGPNPS